MIDNQTTIFEMLYPTYKITKPIRLITLFSGYDSQALALNRLGIDYEHYITCEWAINSIQALKDLHFENVNEDYSKNFTKEQLVEHLYFLGISSNYDEPMSLEQIKRLPEKKIRTITNNIANTNNLVNIQKAKGKDLCIKEKDKFTYLLTYSFPCQDLSLGGYRKGMSDTSTRSGMLWEVERLLDECKEIGELPDILLMENVPQVKTNDPIAWNKWTYKLEQLGYKNYCQDLIATDYGIPQTRNRTFMVSILGDYNYTFPKPIPLKLKLKDLLEDNVDEKYFLSEAMLNYMYGGTGNLENYDRKEVFERNFKENDIRPVASTITTNNGNRCTDTFIKVKNNTKQGYLEAKEGDGIDLSFPTSTTKRSRVQKDKIQTLTTRCDRLGTVNDMRIRKLTPKECFRLMGVKDEEFEKIAKNQSDNSLYHLAGDSIVVNVLEAIIGKLI